MAQCEVAEVGARPDVDAWSARTRHRSSAWRDKQQFPKLLLPLSKLDLSRLPALVDQTKRELGWEGIEVTHVIIVYGAPFANQFLIRVYAKNDHESGRVEYALSGRKHKVFR